MICQSPGAVVEQRLIAWCQYYLLACTQVVTRRGSQKQRCMFACFCDQEEADG